MELRSFHVATVICNKNKNNKKSHCSSSCASSVFPCTKAWQLALSRSLSSSDFPHICSRVVHAPLSPLRQWRVRHMSHASLGTARITGNRAYRASCACAGRCASTCDDLYFPQFFLSFLRQWHFKVLKTYFNYPMSDFGWYLTGTTCSGGSSNHAGWVKPQMVEPQFSITKAQGEWQWVRILNLGGFIMLLL